MTEPWLQGTLTEYPVLQRAVLHSLQMAQEDTTRWCGNLDDREVHERPFGLPSVAFQLRHIARSLDRFCTYAEGKPLTEPQLSALASEMENTGTSNSIFSELGASLENTRRRLHTIIRQPLDTPIAIGRKRLPTTLAGLLVHAAEHTQRHVGQAITTAKLILAQRP
ncbi:MAG: DinB family protein [Acidobacteriaceae bacterium]